MECWRLWIHGGVKSTTTGPRLVIPHQCFCYAIFYLPTYLPTHIINRVCIIVWDREYSFFGIEVCHAEAWQLLCQRREGSLSLQDPGFAYIYVQKCKISFLVVMCMRDVSERLARRGQKWARREQVRSETHHVGKMARHDSKTARCFSLLNR